MIIKKANKHDKTRQYTSLYHAAYIVSVDHHTHPLVLSSLKFMARFDIGEFILLFSLKNRF